MEESSDVSLDLFFLIDNRFCLIEDGFFLIVDDGVNLAGLLHGASGASGTGREDLARETATLLDQGFSSASGGRWCFLFEEGEPIVVLKSMPSIIQVAKELIKDCTRAMRGK